MKNIALEEAIDIAKEKHKSIAGKGSILAEQSERVSENWIVEYRAGADISGFVIFAAEGGLNPAPRPAYEYQYVRLSAGFSGRGRSGYDSRIVGIRRDTGADGLSWIVFENTQGKDVFGLCDVTRADMEKIMSLMG